MAKTIILSSGSIMNGSPITFSIEPNKLQSSPAFHRVIIEVKCGISGRSYETIKMSSPVESEINSSNISIDISSALRTLRDSYTYLASSMVFPYVSFNVRAYDEYMIDGEVFTNQDEIYFPSKNEYLRTIFGAFSDFDRMTSDGKMNIKVLSRKPTASPHLVSVGETFVYPIPYSDGQSLENSSELNQPESKEEIITKEGLQTLGNQVLFAMPSSELKKRRIFRFINSFGVLESISLPCEYSKKVAITSNSYVVARQETFNVFSRSVIRKQNNKETWLFTSDPLTEEWLYWYVHEFMMSENMWILVNDQWLPCSVIPDDDTTIIDRSTSDFYNLSFSIDLDINGSPLC